MSTKGPSSSESDRPAGAGSGAPPLVVGIGELLWGLLPDGKQMGGAPANFAYHARALGAAWDVIPWTAGLGDLAARADAVCFGSLAQRSPVSRTTIGAFLDATRPECLRVLDLNLRQSYFSRELIAGLLGRATGLKLNDEELGTVSRMLALPGSESQALAGLLEACPLSLIALTKGPAGSRLFGRGVDLVHPGHPVETADTVGAGDAFTAALVTGMLRHKGWEEISERANRVAAYVCSRTGAWPKLPAELAAWA